MHNIVYKNSSRARKLRITIKPDGTCVVIMPKRLPKVIAERFVLEKQTWIEKKREEMRKRYEGKGKLLIRPFKEAKLDALRFTTQRGEELNRHYGFSYKKVSVRNQKTRWGSCSKRGNLSFNYRILFLPPHLADYLITHELCHLQEFNHSQKFWNLVAQTFPNHKELRRELQTFIL